MKQSVEPVECLRGKLDLPPDKSIAQRAALFALLSDEMSKIGNYPRSEDPQTALGCIEQLGARVGRNEEVVTIKGVGRDGISTPERAVDCGNSGTVMRLLSGILAGAGVGAELTGDDSLNRRPMKRIAEPLGRMGAVVTTSANGCPPLLIKREAKLKPIRYRLPVASAQLKSCVLLAGLFGEEPTEVIEPLASRNHTETMLQLPVIRQNGENIISSRKSHPIPPQNLNIPGDFSAAAFWMVGASVLEGSELLLPSTGINPTRCAALHILHRMGADLEVRNKHYSGREPVADLLVRPALLKPTEIRPDEIPNAIDELPVLCVAMAFADGVSRISGAEELRYKECDRLSAMETVLKAAGVRVDAHHDGLTIHGKPGRSIRAAGYDSRHDHRIAMSAAILSLKADGVSNIDKAEAAAVSYPDFWSHLEYLRHI